ncbi:MAG: arsenate reductase ArsC [Deltaproteobacteria bacterium]|nr:arsenate reductase ArsC [Deltaproteobacteria bacterium]
MHLEILYTPGCPNRERLRRLVGETLAALGLTEQILEIPVASAGPATGLPPAVLIDGVDLEPESARLTGSPPRVYLNGTGLPDREKLRFRIARAAGLKTVLFICTGNAIRSQMAEALVNHYRKGRWVAFSAGFQPAGIHPLVVQVLREIGLDAARQETKHVDLFNNCPFDRIVSLCSEADRMCTFYPAFGNRIHLPFQDPLSASVFGFGWQGLFRKLRDEMQEILLPRLE